MPFSIRPFNRVSVRSAQTAEVNTHTRMMRLSILTVLLLFLSGCINIGAQLQPEDTSVKVLKAGSDCVPIIFGFGFGTATIERAKVQLEGSSFGDTMPVGAPITKVRRVELVDRMFLNFGERCIEVTGE